MGICKDMNIMDMLFIFFMVNLCVSVYTDSEGWALAFSILAMIVMLVNFI